MDEIEIAPHDHRRRRALAFARDTSAEKVVEVIYRAMAEAAFVAATQRLN
jgi:hypothetical protein